MPKGHNRHNVTKAAASNGWETGRYLIDRYEGFSKQRARSLQVLIENIRHIHGTNRSMTRHVIAEYEKPPRFWIGKTIPALGKVTGLDNGDYIVDESTLKHWEFMQLLSEARTQYSV